MRLARGFVFFLAAVCRIQAQSISLAENNPAEKPGVLNMAPDKVDPKMPASTLSITTKGPLPTGYYKATFTTKLWIASSLAVYAAASLDMHATEETVERVNRLHKQYPFFPNDYSFESDPLARPLLKLPAPAYYACGAALATGVNWLGFRMTRSKRFRKVWWLPQAFSAGANTHGYLTYQ